MDIRSFFTKTPLTKITKIKTKSPKIPSKTKRLKITKTPQNTSPRLSENKEITKAKNITQKQNHLPYISLTEVFKEIEKTSGRLDCIQMMSEFYKKALKGSLEEFIAVVYLSVNQFAPPYENKELGIGDQILMKAIESVTGNKVSRIKKEIAKTGDLALAAEKFKSQQTLLFKPNPLTCLNVFKKLKNLTEIQGEKSRDLKIGVIRSLLTSAKGSETKYLIRSLQGKLRIGFSEASVISSLAALFAKEESNADQLLRQVYSEMPNWDRFLTILYEKGIKKFKNNCFLTPGIPIKAMLARPSKGINEVLEKFPNSKITFEYKYDGERIQLHYSDSFGFRFFSRNAESITGKYPDVERNLRELFGHKMSSFILDCEVVAFDTKLGKILPFQTLMTRKRKGVKEGEITVGVCLFCFDLLYFNGEPLINTSLSNRKNKLLKNFPESPGKFRLVTNLDSSDPAEIKSFFNKAISDNCEGLMVKTLNENATYQPSKRSLYWLKIKKDYLQSTGDTFDLVPIGGYYGKGKRVGVFGAFLVACYDTSSEEFQAICKIGTGLSESVLADLSKFHSDPQRILPKPPIYYKLPADDLPEVWFKAEKVWEIKCADLSISPKYGAALGLVDEKKGIALRFPRFVRVREDKNAEDATSADQVANMYRMQFK